MVCGELGVGAMPEELATFGGSVVDWPAFPDSAAALASLKRRFALAVITNCDDDLFAASSRRLGVEFDFVITAQQCGGYKPDPHNFEVAFERIDRPRERILHVAQSLFHDHVPAKALGMTTVWINRRHDRPGSGRDTAGRGDPRPHDARHGDVRGDRHALGVHGDGELHGQAVGHRPGDRPDLVLAPVVAEHHVRGAG